MRQLLTALLALALAPAAAHAAPAGALTQLSGAPGCFKDPRYHQPLDGCTKAHGLASTQNVVLSPDGRNLYASSNFSWGLDAFARDAATGALRQLAGTAGCIAAKASAACRRGRAVKHAWGIAVSRDGRFVYSGVAGDGNTGLAVFRRAKP